MQHVFNNTILHIYAIYIKILNILFNVCNLMLEFGSQALTKILSWAKGNHYAISHVMQVSFATNSIFLKSTIFTVISFMGYVAFQKLLLTCLQTVRYSTCICTCMFWYKCYYSFSICFILWCMIYLLNDWLDHTKSTRFQSKAGPHCAITRGH